MLPLARFQFAAFGLLPCHPGLSAGSASYLPLHKPSQTLVLFSFFRFDSVNKRAINISTNSYPFPHISPGIQNKSRFLTGRIVSVWLHPYSAQLDSFHVSSWLVSSQGHTFFYDKVFYLVSPVNLYFLRMVIVSPPTLLETADLSRPIPENSRKLSHLVQIEERFVQVGVSSYTNSLINVLFRNMKSFSERLDHLIMPNQHWCYSTDKLTPPHVG